MKPFVITILFFLSIFNLQAQYANKIWYFGEYAGVDFNTTPPSTLSNGASNASDNSSTITDSVGNLLFYTNGLDVWNKNHTLMPNGTNLGGNFSAGQSALIVPQPLSNLYYIFTVGGMANDGLKYSVVDMSLNAGLGGVTTKANYLYQFSTEKLDAVYNPNDTSYWVISHIWNSNQYWVYKITQSGLQTASPVVSSVGSTHSGGSPSGYNAMGQMTISEDGSKLGTALYSDGKIEIFDFNLNTGQLSNPITLTGFNNPWGIAISDNNQFLYYTEWYGTQVWQLNISSGNAYSILASKTLVGTGSFPNSTSYKIGYLERSWDGKVYIAKFNQNYISCINNPDLQGTACNFVDNAVSLGSKTCTAGLSRTVTVYPVFSPCNPVYSSDSIWICENDSFSYGGVYYQAPNLITDTLTTYNQCDSIINIYLFESKLPIVNLGNDTAFCTGDSLQLSYSGSNVNFLWNTGDTSNSIYVSSAGTYWLEVSDSLCSNADTILIQNNSISKIEIFDTTMCAGENYNISLPTAYQYEWWDGSNFPSIQIYDSGYFWVDITDNCKKYQVDFYVSLKDCNCKVFIPNAFTPNDDGKNDGFYPDISCEAKNYHLMIFNRWGKLIWESRMQNEAWDGLYLNEEVPEGVYFYVLNYDYFSGQIEHVEHHGSVTLFR